jgi:3alpha(or 20beta)-hydroxysteroid dehydrogenase
MTVLQDKVVVVTGAARGQGAAEVAALLDAGATVVACDHSKFDATASSSRLQTEIFDVADPVAWSALADDLEQRYGSVHGLVNNAGTAMRSRLGEVDLDAWNRVFAINTAGPMLGIQALLPLLGPGSSIVNVGSLAAVTAHPAVAYTASKWALRGLSRAASLQLGEQGIRVNLINPGFIETPMTAAAPEVFRESNLINTPLARVGIVDDVAPLVVFLISDASSYISGAEIPVDGGQWAHGGAKYAFDAEKRTGAE